jgi:hypothetical protein
MGRSIFRQDTQVRKSVTYSSATLPSLANYQTNPVSLEDDMNVLRSAHHLVLKNQAGNWYDDLNVPSALETGVKRGVNDLNTALHAVEKKRVLRDVWKLTDIYPGLDLAILLVNDLKAKYEAHRVLIAGSVHGAADNTNAVTAPNATSLATANTLANDIKTQYNAHRVLTTGGVHGAADTTNVVTSANATDLATLITLVNEMRTDYEAHRVLTSGGVHGASDTTNTISALAVGSTTQVHVLTAAQLPTQTTAAIGAVTTLGTVAATATTFGTAGLDEVVGSTAVSPKNLMPLVDADNHLDPIMIGGKQLFGLFQTESATDGSTMTGTTPNRAQISFVVRNNTGDDLELATVPVTQGFNFASRERVRLEDLNEQDFLKGVIIEFPSATTVTRQVAYNNQGVTPVEMGTNSYLDLATGLEWDIRDNLNAILLKVLEGSAGGTSEVQVAADVDVFNIDAVLNDFLNGIKVDTGAAGTTIQIGMTANQIDSGGVLKVASGGGADLSLAAALELNLTDSYRGGSTWSLADGINLAASSAEWSAFETAFGEVSLMNAIVQAKSAAYRRRVFAVATANVNADNDISGPANDNNLDANLGDLSAGTFTDDYDLYLNGQYLRPGANFSANHDFYPGTSLANGQIRFEFKMHTGDQLCLIDRTA